MTGRDDLQAAVTFAEKLLLVLDQGSFTSTYKYAVLLALLDLAMESFGAEADAPLADARLEPHAFTTTQLAEKFVALYWPQARPYAPERTPLWRGRDALEPAAAGRLEALFA